MKNFSLVSLLGAALILTGCNSSTTPKATAQAPAITTQALSNSPYEKAALATRNNCNVSVALTMIDQGYEDYSFLKKGLFCDDASLEETHAPFDGVDSAVVIPTTDNEGYVIYVTTEDKIRYDYSSITRQTTVHDIVAEYNAKSSDYKTMSYIKQCAAAVAMMYIDYLKPYTDFPAGTPCDSPLLENGPTNKSGVVSSGIYADMGNPDNFQIKATSELGHTFLFDLQSGKITQIQ